MTLAPRRSAAGPQTIWWLVLALAVVALVVTTLWWTGRVRELPAAGPAEQRNDPRRLAALARMLLWSLLIVLVFVVGALVMMRVGRALVRPGPPRPTRYVDAWSRHRLTPEQLAQYSDDADTGGPPDAGS